MEDGSKAKDTGHQPKVAIIVVSWNRKKDIGELFASLAGVSYPNLELYLVDNGSTDGTVELIEQQFPGTIVTRNGRNLGFAAANNIGARQALERGADYLLFLNDDTIVPPDFLDTLVAFASQDPSVGVLGPKIYYHSDPQRIWATGDQTHFGEIDRGQADTLREVDCVIGCAFFVSRQAVEKAGLMDEDFFLYCEEDEYCYRIRNAGFRLYYLPSSKLWHKAPLTGDNLKPYQSYYTMRNSMLVRRKKYRGFRFIVSLGGYFGIYVPWYLWYCARHGVYGNLGPTLRGLRDGILWLAGIKKAGKSESI